MAYGTVKVDNITFDNGGSDQNVTVSGLYRATTSGVTLSGTIAATTVSGVTVIGSTTVSGATVTGTTANFTSGNFSNIISSAATMSGALIMANQQQVRFREAVGNGVNHIALQAPAIVSADQTITLPDQTGTVITTGDNGSVSSTMLATNLTISAAAGSASTPSIAFTGDTNTGIYSPGADTLAFVEGGVEAMRIDSSGNVGIGTTSPARPLDVNGSVRISSGSVIEFGGTVTNFITGDNSNNYLAFGTNSSERLRIDSSGRVGIGTSSPGQNITIQSAASGTAPTFKLQNPIDSNSSEGAANNLSAGQLLFGSTGAFLLSAKIESVYDSNASFGRSASLIFSGANGAGTLTERMRINSAGYIKASNNGTYASSTGSLHELKGNPDDNVLRVENYQATLTGAIAGVRIIYSATSPNTTNCSFLYCDDSTALRAEIRSNGGLANFSANNANLSDRNAKKDISFAADTWSCVKEWEIVNYRYKDQPDDADLNLGVIAQQVAESCPEVITIFQEAEEATETEPAKEERLGVKEQQMYWMAIKALQEAQARIEALEADVAQLKGA